MTDVHAEGVSVDEHVHVEGDPPCPGCGFTGNLGPVLVHRGVYALYETPAGGRHLVYQPDGAAGDFHVPDIPAEALPLVQSFLNNGLPPAVLALLQGKASPVKLLGLMRSAIGGGEAAGDGPG
jgi:hypothetical protein